MRTAPINNILYGFSRTNTGHLSFNLWEKNTITCSKLKATDLQITLLRDNVKDLQVFLQREKENGNRFLSFPSAGIPAKEGFAVFKSAFEALEHAQRHGTAKEPYAVRSVLAIETEINKLLEPRREHQRPLKEPERIQRSSRGQDLSR